MKHLTDEQCVFLSRFVSEYWTEFVGHCDGEELAEEIVTALEAD